MINLTNGKMYLHYFSKVVYLKILKQRRGLDFTGRINSKNANKNGYEGCYSPEMILNDIGISEKDSILDVGCGKGLFLYYATKYNFCRIDGIEYNDALVAIARRNVKIMNDKRIRIYHTDAREFRLYGRYNYFFVNNPFGKDEMETFVGLLVDSFKRHKNRLTVIYQFPFRRDIFERYGFVEKYYKFPNLVLTLE